MLMKKLFVLLAALGLLCACEFDFDVKLSPTIAGWSYAVEKAYSQMGNADAEKALEAVIIGGKTGWACKKGETRDFQIQLMGSKFGGKPDKLEIYYFLRGTVTFLSGSSCAIKMKDNFPYIEGTYAIQISTKDDKEYVELDGGEKQLKMHFWHETD